MKLYEYQQRVLDAIKSDPSHSQLISMPTGTGKTITFLATAKMFEKNTLIIVHREELLNQTREKAIICGFNENEISVIKSTKKESFKKLNICMVQTLVNHLDKYNPDDIDLIIVDEAHHATANSYRKVFEHFKVFEQKKILMGFTATPLRGDGKCLSTIFVSHSFKMTLSEATQMGYICPVHGIRIETKKSLKEIDTTQGDYDISQLDKIMNCEEINSLIADRCEHLKKTPGIVFCTSVNHAQEIARKLREKKRKAISVSYQTPKKTLSRIMNLLKEGRIEFITNAVKLSEGFDFPKISTVVLARPTRSPVLYKQMIGRGLRKSDKKFDCLVMEFAGNDEKMICWEDIDENCTFQTTSAEEKRSISDAKKIYKNKFSSSSNVIEILDVRVSPFQFYECRIRRLIKYKDIFRILPFDDGFLVSKFIKKPTKCRESVYNNFCYFFFWKEVYKSFYSWETGNGDLYYNECGWPIKELEKMTLYYATANKMGKWYPSEEEPMNIFQKKFLGDSFKTNARKAEMMIEEIQIKKAIDQFMIPDKVLVNGIMEII